MKLTLIISDFSIKNQIYNGFKPSAKHSLTKKLANALFSKRWIVIPLEGKQFYKIYIENKHYRAVVHELDPMNQIFLLVYFRSKDDPASENISNYQNESSERILYNHLKAVECLKANRIHILEFEK